MKKVLYIAAIILFGTTMYAQQFTPSSGRDTITAQSPEYDNTIHNIAGLQEVPEFPGGLLEFQKLLYSNFNFRKIERSCPVGTYRTYISFVIEKDGTISNCKVIKGPGYGIGEEALRVVKLSPKWTPGYQNNVPVRTAFTQPLVVNVTN